MKTTTEKESAQLIDARGPRFSAGITTVVLALAFVFHSPLIIAFQAIVFAIGAFINPTKTPYAFAYKTFIKPRLKGVVPTEDVRPPKFAQAVGFAFTTVALIANVVGMSALFSIAVGFALVAAFLNAAFDYCLGCVLYLSLIKITRRK